MDINKINVSVVIPVRGKINLLPRAINSCLYQTLLPDEIILVDDSIDDSGRKKIAKIADNFTKKISANQEMINLILLNSQGRGVSAARNLAITTSKGNFIAFLDADDYFLPDKLKIQYQAMVINGAVFSHTNYLAMKNGFFPTLIDTSFNQGFKQDEIITYRGCSIATPTVMVKGDTVRAFDELFPNGITVGEDQIAWTRIAHQSQNSLVHLTEALTIVTVDERSNSQLYENIEKANSNLILNAKQIGIKKPRFYEYGGVQRSLRRLAPRKGKFWQILRAVIREIKR